MLSPNPYNLLAGLIFGVIGWGAFSYGRKLELPKTMGFGLALMVYPYFIHNPWLLWGCGIVLLVGSWRYRRE
jgi:hypothetical protein